MHQIVQLLSVARPKLMKRCARLQVFLRHDRLTVSVLRSIVFDVLSTGTGVDVVLDALLRL